MSEPKCKTLVNGKRCYSCKNGCKHGRSGIKESKRSRQSYVKGGKLTKKSSIKKHTKVKLKRPAKKSKKQIKHKAQKKVIQNNRAEKTRLITNRDLDPCPCCGRSCSCPVKSDLRENIFQNNSAVDSSTFNDLSHFGDNESINDKIVGILAIGQCDPQQMPAKTKSSASRSRRTAKQQAKTKSSKVKARQTGKTKSSKAITKRRAKPLAKSKQTSRPSRRNAAAGKKTANKNGRR